MPVPPTDGAQEIAIRINDPKAKLSNYASARKSLLGNQNAGGRFAKMEQEITAQNSQFIDTQVDQQQAIISRQDNRLAEISEDVGILGQMGRQINDELDEQDTFAAARRDCGHSLAQAD